MRILLTGGAGYIGSHTAVALAEAGHSAILLDNFSNSRPQAVDRIAAIVGRPVTIHEGDVRDTAMVARLLEEEKIDAVIHLAGLKAVAESAELPLDYHANNVGGLISLLEAMDDKGVRSLIFSSSATVYGEPERLPIDEEHPTSTANPYGRTKLICEHILADVAAGSERWNITALRYFNPVGAHSSGLIGEDPTGQPNNLMPLVTRVAAGQLAQLSVFGSDYPTPDGSAIRDFIDVNDLAEGHVAAVEALARSPGLEVYNLGTGRGVSVFELISAFEDATGIAVPRKNVERRAGDIGVVYAAVDKARRDLGWTAQRDLPEMCASSWRFASQPATTP